MATEDLIIRIAERGANQTASQLGKVGKAGRAVGLAIAAAAAIAGAGVSSAMNFETVMAEVKAVTGASTKDMATMSEAALDMGAKTGLGAAAAGQGMAELGKAGLDAKTVIGALPATMTLAQAGAMQLGEAAATTANVMGLFGLQASKAGHIADALAMAANQTTADVSDFAMALKQGGSAANAAGLSFDDTTAALMALAKIGVKGQDAGTSLKAMLTQLAKPTAEAARLLAKLGIDVWDAQGNMLPMAKVAAQLAAGFKGLTREQQLASATTLVGTDGQRALLAIMRQGEGGIDRFGRALSKQGTAAEVARIKQDTLAGSLRRLQATVDAILIRKFTPFLKDAANALNDFLRQAQRGEGVGGAFVAAMLALRDAARWVGGTFDDIQVAAEGTIHALDVMSPTIAGLATALLILNARLIAGRIAWAIMTAVWSAATIAAGGLAVATGVLNRVMMMNPFVLVAAAVAALVGVLVTLWRNNEGFRNTVISVWNAVKSAVGSASDWLRPKIAAVGQVIGVIASAAVSHGTRIIGMWRSVVSFFASIPGKISGFFSGMWDGIVSGVKSALNSIISIINTFIGTYNSTVGKIGGLVGADMQVSEIPQLAQGGTVRGVGSWVTGEDGPERNTKRPDGSVVVEPLTSGGGQRMGAPSFTVVARDAGMQALLEALIERIEHDGARAG